MEAARGSIFGSSVAVLCNYGIRLKPEVYATLIYERINNVVVWLDNDSEEVIERANILGRTFQLIGKVPVTVENTKAEPKHLDKHVLLGTMEKHL